MRSMRTAFVRKTAKWMRYRLVKAVILTEYMEYGFSIMG